MVKKREPTHLDLVRQVLRTAEKPLTVREILEEMNHLRPVTTKNPIGTIREVIKSSRLPVPLGDGRYGYLPLLLRGSLFRLPLPELESDSPTLSFGDELRMALWPASREGQRQRDLRAALLKLPTGDEAALYPKASWFAPTTSPMPESLRGWLAREGATAQDALLIDVLDSEAGLYEVLLEMRRQRDSAAVARRNRELAGAAHRIASMEPERDAFLWDLAAGLVAQGIYHDEVPPDPLESVLRADPRFAYAGLNSVALEEALTPERRERIRERLEDEERWRKADESREEELVAGSEPGEHPPPSGRMAAERTLFDVGKLLAGREFGSIEEVNAFLQESLAQGRPEQLPPRSPLERAQELIYDAWRLSSSRQRIDAARRALAISPDCTDAYVLLAEETARTPEAAAKLYAQGIEAGERALGKRFFRDNVGGFWGILESRPYMRARAGLAHALWALGKPHEAVAHLWETLRLNPGDNQGLRYNLLTWLLEMGDREGAKKLLGMYEGDIAAYWSYGTALHAFTVSGDSSRARRLVEKAMEGNPHVLPYLLSKKKMPRRLPDYIGIGDEREGIAVAAEQMLAWYRMPGALRWLEEVAREKGVI